MDTHSCRSMRLFARKYLGRRAPLKILDVGSLDVNGSYRDIFNRTGWEYVGLDIVPGPNVDVVAENPYEYPFTSESFDVVVSGQTAEHVEDIYRFAKELARLVRVGGWVCLIIPWWAKEHRHPKDCWRVLPDGMEYLLRDIAGLHVEIAYMRHMHVVGVATKHGD